ncbi:AP-3 complex subunit sigma-2 [Eumeta japonica]|uniref:AP-3 complex subunit sigma-2 n=1 Tax=Eumeta variegata TaxID=151549 RepID=A0A4C1WGG4_EUMVA|nr:AP-3 complex subunit sigma-2 [Eumeta japonica]
MANLETDMSKTILSKPEVFEQFRGFPSAIMFCSMTRVVKFMLQLLLLTKWCLISYLRNINALISRFKNEDMQQQIIKETFQLVSKRDDNVCNFLEGGSLIGGSDYKLIYRHYATLYFVFCVDSSESELGILDLIQVFVETLDKCFENVCELDLIFHADAAHQVLDELVMGGMVLQTNMSDILCRLQEQNKMQKAEAGISAAPARAVSAVKSMNLPQQLRDIKLPDLPQAIKTWGLGIGGLTHMFINIINSKPARGCLTCCPIHGANVSILYELSWGDEGMKEGSYPATPVAIATNILNTICPPNDKYQNLTQKSGDTFANKFFGSETFGNKFSETFSGKKDEYENYQQTEGVSVPNYESRSMEGYQDLSGSVHEHDGAKRKKKRDKNQVS